MGPFFIEYRCEHICDITNVHQRKSPMYMGLSNRVGYGEKRKLPDEGCFSRFMGLLFLQA